MKKLALLVLLLPGCSLLNTSFYDDNESMLAVNIRYEVDRLDCSSPKTSEIKGSVNKLYFYSESKKSRDVHALAGIMKETADPLQDTMSTTFCTIKKPLLEKQSKDVANAVMRRY